MCSLRIDRQSAVYTFWDRLSFMEMPSHNRSVKSLSSSTYCGPIIPSMESIVRRHNPAGKSWPCILVTAVRPAWYDRLGMLRLFWRSKKPFTMQAAFSKLTLENTSWLAVLLSLALGRVFSQSENCCSLDLLSMAIVWGAHFLFLPHLGFPPSGLSYSWEGGHDLEILPGWSILGTSGELCLSNHYWKWDGTERQWNRDVNIYFNSPSWNWWYEGLQMDKHQVHPLYCHQSHDQTKIA